MKKIKLIYLGVLLCTSPPLLAKVTTQNALNDQKYYSQQLQGIAVPNSVRFKDWIDNGRAPNVENSNDWELRVWTSITRGGCCGYVTRTWFGKFDRKTGKFLGYISQQTESDSINGPGSYWK